MAFELLNYIWKFPIPETRWNMQIQKVLFPTDFSPASEAALDHAISLAQ